MIHAVIIDDEINGLKSLELMIERFIAGVKVVAATVDPVKGIELINNYRPDIVFLDINMPQMNGFELLEKLEFRSFYLIFTTAHGEFALHAIRQSAVDYLLKPIDLTELNEAVEKVKARMREKQNLPDMRELLKQLYGFNRAKIAVPTKTAIEYVFPNEILYIEGYSNYSVVALVNGMALTAYKALKEYDQLLCKKEKSFIRIHNSFVINVNYVTRYVKEDGGYAIIQDKKSIPISKHRKEAFLKLVNFHP